MRRVIAGSWFYRQFPVGTHRASGGSCQRQLKTDPLTAVASSDNRNGGGPEDLVRSLPSQSLSRSGVELVDHRLDVISVVLG
jgi:hypothetical protein